MKKSDLILLLSAIAVMLAVIVGMVWYLYYDTSKAASSVREEPAASATAQTAPPSDTLREFPKAEEKPASPTSFPVVNCFTAKENLLRQNKDLSLELIDHNGKSLWKIPFPGKLCGSVAQVDYYNNRKVQFMVADGRRVHLMDRLGREVESFPRTMPEDIIFGPEEILNHGVKYYKLTTKGGALYFTLKETKILTELPE